MEKNNKWEELTEKITEITSKMFGWSSELPYRIR